MKRRQEEKKEMEELEREMVKLQKETQHKAPFDESMLKTKEEERARGNGSIAC